MIGEVSLYGVYVPVLLIWALLALVPTFGIRAVLLATGFYQFVWHRALFDIALYIAIWGGLATFASRLIEYFGS